ncbi:MAG: queuosine precursor transporter [Anaerolineae bacterium]|nr:queuosine precursor transporter [Anaerolineae bacterium]
MWPKGELSPTVPGQRSTDTTHVRLEYSGWFVIIVAVFITCLLTANIIAVKVVAIGNLTGPAGLIIFPVSYIFGDVLTEVYGYRLARRVIWLGFLCNVIMVAAIYISQLLPAAPFWEAQAAYERILGFTPRLLVASFLAYLIGEFANSWVLAKMKIATQGKWLWTRTIGSTIIGEGLDSLVFVTIAFIGVMPTVGVIFSTIITQWLLKTVYEALATPFTYVVVSLLKRVEGVDAFDYDTSFNPIAFHE